MRLMGQNSLSYEILSRLEDFGEDMFDFMLDPPRTIYQAIKRLDPEQRKHRIRYALSRLKKRGLVESTIRNNQKYIAINKKGRTYIIRHLIQKKKRMPWDRKWRIVIFDIRETTRRDRNFLRRQLQRFGFTELQKSVWVIPWDVTKELHDFLSACRAELVGDVRFLTVEKIDSDYDLKKRFDLRKVK